MKAVRILSLFFVSTVSLTCLNENFASVQCEANEAWCQAIFFGPINSTWRGCAQFCSEARFSDLQQTCCSSNDCNGDSVLTPSDDPYATFLTVFKDQGKRSTFVYSAATNSSIFNTEGSANGGISFWALEYPKDFIVTYFYTKVGLTEVPNVLEFPERQSWWESHYLESMKFIATKNRSDLDYLRTTTGRLKTSTSQSEAQNRFSSDWRSWAIAAVSDATAENADIKVARVPLREYPSTPHSISPAFVFSEHCPAIISPVSYCPFGDPFNKGQTRITSEVPAGRFGLMSQLSVNPDSFNFVIRGYNGTLPFRSGQHSYSIVCGEWQYFTLDIPANTMMVKLHFEQPDCKSPSELCPLATIFINDAGCPNADVHTSRQVLHHSSLLTFAPRNTVDIKIVVAVHADVVWGRFTDGKLRDSNQLPPLNNTECCNVNTSIWRYTVRVDLEEDQLVVWRSILFLLVFVFVALILTASQWSYVSKQGVVIRFWNGELNSGIVERPAGFDPQIRPSFSSMPAATVAIQLTEMSRYNPTLVNRAQSSPTMDINTSGNTATTHPFFTSSSASIDDREGQAIDNYNNANTTSEPTTEQAFMFASLFYPSGYLALSSVLFIVGMLVWTPSFQYALSLSSLDKDFASICHFNNECRLDVSLFGWVEIKAFNQVISNFGYIVCGFYTIIYIFLDNKLQLHRGFTTRLPQRQLGNFYGIGVAITCEGLFSGVYHVCPTLGNFQFDTIMMFFITGTILLSLFGRRHANTFSQGWFFGCFGGMIVTNMFGVYMYMTGYTGTFWAICLPFVIIAVMIALTHFWYNRVTPFGSFMTFVYVILGKCGYKKVHAFNGENSYDAARFMNSLSRERKSQMCGVVVIWLLDVLVISLAAAYLMYSSDAFLVLSSINMLFYLGIYLTFKIWAGRNGFPSERLTWDLYALGLSTALIVVVSLYIFLIPVTNKALSINHTYEFSAERGSCVFLYFDLHDVWHLLGSVGLCLLTILIYRLDVSSDLDLAQLRMADLKRLF